ncbi:CoxG family protein [Steroidobacter flavus]|uniref:CoxG family protein n=1 Tax=Steroidobacter flavus TaxID=1842136 RepID=A0ABV8T0F6_9GAMM
MKMTGEERIPASLDRVWQALNDPQVLQQCIPGCQSLARDGDDRLRAVVEVKIGPIGARFNANIALSNIQPSQGYTLIGEGQGGTVGTAKATIHVRLQSESPVTRLTYDVDAQVGGRLAQLGGPIIDATAKQFAAKFFSKFGEIVGGRSGASQAAAGREISQAAAEVEPVPRAKDSLPYAWILAVVVAALTGFLVGRGEGGTGSDWAGLCIGLLVIIVGVAGVEYGRRVAAPQIVVDAAALARLLRGERQ